MTVGAALPTRAISIVAGIAFLGLGAWTLRCDMLTPGEEAKADRSNLSTVVFGAILIAGSI